MKSRYAQLLEEYNETFDQLKLVESVTDFDCLMQKARELEAEIHILAILRSKYEPERNQRK